MPAMAAARPRRRKGFIADVGYWHGHHRSQRASSAAAGRRAAPAFDNVAHAHRPSSMPHVSQRDATQQPAEHHGMADTYVAERSDDIISMNFEVPPTILIRLRDA